MELLSNNTLNESIFVLLASYFTDHQTQIERISLKYSSFPASLFFPSPGAERGWEQERLEVDRDSCSSAIEVS